MKNSKLNFKQPIGYYVKLVLGIVVGLMVYDFINGFYDGVKMALQNP
jgi:hypothetical protein